MDTYIYACSGPEGKGRQQDGTPARAAHAESHWGVGLPEVHRAAPRTYAGFVGYFCIASGIALGTNVTVDTLSSWAHLFALDPAIKLAPTLATLAVLLYVSGHVSHPLALPGALAAVPLLFHAVLKAAGWTLADAQAHGWAIIPTVRRMRPAGGWAGGGGGSLLGLSQPVPAQGGR